MEPSVSNTAETVDRKSGFSINICRFGFSSWTMHLNEGEYRIGRGANGCDIYVPNDRQISRLHCTIRVERGTVVVTDHNSMNGTYVNGKKITTCLCSLKDNVTIEIGSTGLILVPLN